ncbi:hypothetical protein CUN60_04100 [Aquella oligotrophica]|uniref:Uncharacterized protein n=1 Tax=Aquella oligotrophica TaxID=2067065 RepID=A0A2I7N4W6_9NEIS|nr:hypothetical protein CUN60_04100 [Aquella oligotrophica]
MADTSKVGFVFAFVVVPTIIFFGSVISILYFFGIMQWIIEKLAFLLRKTIKLSGVESLVVIADIFLGQSEGPMVIGPYVQNMTRSELACAFVAGLANLSGSTLGMYLSFLAAGNHAEELMVANSLLTATFMNATSAIVFAKMIFPETNYEAIMDAKHLKVTGSRHDSLVDAIMHGAFTGVKIGVAICAALMAVIPLIHAIDGFLFWIGSLVHINDYIATSSNKSFDGLSLEYIFGLIFRFFAFFMGLVGMKLCKWEACLGRRLLSMNLLPL